MNILAIDSSTEILSVALRCGTPQRIYTSTRDVGLKHSQLLMTLVSRLMDDAQCATEELDLVACSRGPGSFTGLRIGMATAKGVGEAIASARGLSRAPVISVPTLDVMAAALPDFHQLLVPVIDGRKRRFYGAIFARGVRLTPDFDLEAEQIVAEITRVRTTAAQAGTEPLSGPEIIISGPHAPLFVERSGDPSAFTIDPGGRRGMAETLISLAIIKYETDGPDATEQGPVYVRSSDAELSHGNRDHKK